MEELTLQDERVRTGRWLGIASLILALLTVLASPLALITEGFLLISLLAFVIGPPLSLVVAMVLGTAVKESDTSDRSPEALDNTEVKKKNPLRKAVFGFVALLIAELASFVLLFPYAGWLSDRSCSQGGDWCGLAGLEGVFLPIGTFFFAGIIGLAIFGAAIAPMLKNLGARGADRALVWVSLALWGPCYLLLLLGALGMHALAIGF